MSFADFLSSQEKAAYLVEWFEKETGIPPLLDVTMKLEDGDAHLNMWYHLLRYLWLAEMYQFSLKTRKAKVFNLSKMVGKGAVKFNRVEKVLSHLTTYMYYVHITAFLTASDSG